jgi:hypothetical protein
MAVVEVPRSYRYICDDCGAEHVQENAGGHYTNSRPKFWAHLKLSRDAYDHQGSAVADGSIERLLCAACSEKVISSINSAIDGLT